MWRLFPQASISWDVVPSSPIGHRSGECIVGAAALQVADMLPAQLPSDDKFLYDSLQDALKFRNANANPRPSLVTQ